MAGEAGRGWRWRSWQTVAVIVALCSLLPSLTCFTLRGLSKKDEQDKVVSEATVSEARTGSILFNGKELESLSGSASAAGNGLLNFDLKQTNVAEMSAQTSELETTANEAAWRRLQPSLYCGQNKMKLKAMGLGAADLTLDMGNAHSLPFTQLPETCRYLVKQNALGLVLVVPVNGCNVIHENGNYVLQMKWRETPVKLTCPMSMSLATVSPKPAEKPRKLPLPQGLLRRSRRKRQTNQPLSIYDPRSPYHYLLYYYYYYYYYYMRMMTPAPTTAQPDTSTTEEPPQMTPPAYPYYPYYYNYPYYPYPLATVPVTTTPPVSSSGMTTGSTTTATGSTNTTTTATGSTNTTTTATGSTTTATGSTTTTTTATGSTTTATGSTTTTTTATGSTTTATGSTTTATSTTSTTKVPHPHYPYFPYFPGGQPLPDNDIYYYQIIQNYYGRTPHPHMPTIPTVTTAEPGQSTTTAKPNDSSTTTSTTTAAPTTTRVCSHTTEPYPGQMSAFASFYDQPFTPEVSVKSGNDDQLPANKKYSPQSGYKSGPQVRGHPPLHPGFHYWQPALGFPHPTDQDYPQFDWRNLLPKHS